MNYDDPRLVAKAKRESKIRERASREVVLSIMATTAGRRWVYERLTALSAFHTPYAPGDPHATMFNCGMQNAGFMFLAEILGCAPSEYITMLRENDNASGSDTSDDNDSGDDTGDDDSASN